jgi:hypothetical protein
MENIKQNEEFKALHDIIQLIETGGYTNEDSSLKHTRVFAALKKYAADRENKREIKAFSKVEVKATSGLEPHEAEFIEFGTMTINGKSTVVVILKNEQGKTEILGTDKVRFIPQKSFSDIN